MQERNISRGNFEQCLKCNICTSVCPMMAANPHYPGPKQAGPDGERYRLKDPAFFDLTLKYCLNCKRCEVACPSGVRVGDIIQMARINYGSQKTSIRDWTLASTDFVGSLVTPFANAVNKALSLKTVKAGLDFFAGVSRHRELPKYSPVKFETWFNKEARPFQKDFRRRVSYYHGCYVNYNFPALGKDFVKVMNACGYGVDLLEKEKCCGVALISNGMTIKAKANAKKNLASIRAAQAKGSPVLTTTSTCTFTIREEYENLLDIPSGDVCPDFMLATKFLYDAVESGEVRLVFKDTYRRKIAYHSACHMEMLGWVIYSVSILNMIPGVKLKMLPSRCCGMAGTFGFKKENYGYSKKIGSLLFDDIKAASPDLVATDCETCKWQIEDSTEFHVMNPISILAEALDLDRTFELNR